MTRVGPHVVVTVALSLVVGVLTASVLVPARPLTLNEEDEDRDATFGLDAVRYRMMRLGDRFGRIPPNAYLRAKARVDLLRSTGAAMRVEQASAAPIDPLMFTNSAGSAATLAATAVSPQSWRWIGPGNIGGRIRALVVNPVNPDTMFAGSVGGGIWKTTNGGASWSPVDDFMAVLSVSSMVIDPVNRNVMYAGTGEGYFNGDAIRGAGIFKSVDGGTTWTQLTATASDPAFYTVNRIALSADGKVLLAATGSGLFRSTDAGAAFTAVIATARSVDVDFHPTDNLKAIATGDGVVWNSVDGGVTWRASSGFPRSAGRIEIAYARSQPDIVYASAADPGGTLYRSINGGVSFTLASGVNLLGNQGWYSNALWVDPIDSNHVIVGGVYAYVTHTGGSTWDPMGGILHADQHAIVSDPRYDGAANRRVFFANDGGIARADDIETVNTTGFRSLNNNLGVTQFYSGAGNAGSGTIIGGTQDNGTLVWTPSSGVSWSQTLGSDGGYTAADPANSSYFYSETIYLSLYRSVTGARDWRALNGIPDAGTAANFIAPFALDPNNPDRMLAGGASLWRSDHVKAATPSWSAIQGYSSSYVSAIAIAPGNSDLVWLARYNRLFKSTNGTAAAPAFSNVAVPANGMITRIAISPVDWNTVYVATGGFTETTILKSTNGGATWIDATGSGTTGLPATPVNDIEIDPAQPDTIYAATEVGVFTSADGGMHWQLPQDGPANVAVNELFWMGATLVAATHGRGMFTAGGATSASPLVTVTPTRLDFGSQTVGASTTARTITVANTGTAPATISGVGITGTHVADFTLGTITGRCASGITLAAGASCTSQIVFRPTATGARSATYYVSSDGVQTNAALSGYGLAAPAPTPTQSALPSPWKSQDIGAIGVAGSTSYTNGTFTIKGAGADIWGAADAFQFAYQPLSGDGSILARLASVENVYAWSKAGVMMRSTLTAGSANVALFVTPSKGIAFQRRAVAGAPTVSTVTSGAAPRWVKITRTGTTIIAAVSSDGAAWTTVGKDTVTLGADVYVGLAVSSHNASRAAAAAFDKAAAARTAALPTGWSSSDVGSVGVKGSASYASGTYTLSGSGADIWNGADGFQYAYRTLTGDGQIVARVASIDPTHRWAKSGVMIRANRNANAPFAMMLVSSGAGSAFQYRTTAGALATSVKGTSTAVAPHWVKIVRAGSVITGYQSPDGIAWQKVGAAAIAFGASADIGLAVTSHDNTRVCRSKFDHVVR